MNIAIPARMPPTMIRFIASPFRVLAEYIKSCRPRPAGVRKPPPMIHCKSMPRASILTALLVLTVAGADTKKKPPDVTVVECNGRRSSGKITFDGRVRNTGEKTITGLVLLFDFLSSDKVILTTLKGPTEDAVLEPGQESS